MENPLPKKLRGNKKNEADTKEKTKASAKATNQYLTYDVLRIIFKYLNAVELSRASMVCRSWLEAANNEKRIRGPVCLMENYNDFVPVQNGSAAYHKKEIIKKLMIKPALGLLFVSNPFFQMEDCHCDVLSPNCYTVTLSTYGVVLNNNEIEENLSNVVCAFLPEIPGVTIKTFVCKDDSLAKSNIQKCVEKYSKDLRKALGEPTKENGKSRCLLLFSDQHGRSITIKISKSLEKCYPRDTLSVWGGIARDVLVCNSETRAHTRGPWEEFALCVGIALTGSLQTWSIIVDKTYKTKDQVEQRLKLLRNSVRLRKHSVGFMFACCERGENMFGECNVESSVFKSLFPEVPLVGCFGDGEFGKSTIPDEPPNKRTTWYNETSTVFLILTYG